MLLLNLQALRGIAAILVVLSHFEQWNAMAEGRACNANFLAIGSYAVYVFFVISGFIIAYAHRNDLGRSEIIPSYIVKRFLRIYPAYIVFSALSLLAAAMGMKSWDINGNMHRSLLELSSAITLIPVAVQNPNSSFLAVGWSLYYELVFYIIFTSFFWSRKLGWWVIGLFSFASISNGVVLSLNCFWISRVSVLFGIGCLLGFYSSRLNLKLRTARVISVFGAAVFIAALELRERNHSITVMLFSLAAVMLVLGAVAADVSQVINEPRWITRVLAWVGTVSYSLYVSHVLVQGILFTMLGSPRSPCIWLLYLVVPIIMAACANWCVEKPAQRFARRITIALCPGRNVR